MMKHDPFDKWVADGCPDEPGQRPRGQPRYGLPHPVTSVNLKDRAFQLSLEMVNISKVRPALENSYLVKGWLDRGTTSVVYGDSNVGKTFFALDLSMHVAARQAWHGAKVAGMPGRLSAGVVYYIYLEGGSGFDNRLCALRKDRPALLDIVQDNGDFTPWPISIDLHGPTDGEAISLALEEEGQDVALIVIDTLAHAMGSGDENVARDMGQLIRNVALIRERTGAHVMLIHHSGKDTTRGARGSNSLRGAVDTEIELTKSGAVIMAEARKQRDMHADKVFAFTLRSVELGLDEDGDQVTSAVIEPTEPVKRTPRLSGQQKVAMQALEDALAHHGEKKNGDIFPCNRQCVSMDHWRQYCDRHSLSSGNGASSSRSAFHKVKTALQNKEIVRVVDGYVWRCEA